MEKYNNAERQLDHYRMQATKISRIVPQKVCQVLFKKKLLNFKGNIQYDKLHYFSIERFRLTIGNT